MTTARVLLMLLRFTGLTQKLLSNEKMSRPLLGGSLLANQAEFLD
nr:MAG TPA: hypothetical protein [Caudoviricetes sp.]